MSGIVCGHGTALPALSVNDKEFMAAWRARREEAIKRGEDPDARLKAIIAQRAANTPLAKLKRKMKKEKGYVGGQRLTPEEEAIAREMDRKRSLTPPSSGEERSSSGSSGSSDEESAAAAATRTVERRNTLIDI
ncbi:hypothetical protein MMC25_005265 [Agyrium rufum]|nr:hypothetical protein [Agyrium rufum]